MAAVVGAAGGGFPGRRFPRGGSQGGSNPPQGGGDDGGREVSGVSRTECEADKLALGGAERFVPPRSRLPMPPIAR